MIQTLVVLIGVAFVLVVVRTLQLNWRKSFNGPFLYPVIGGIPYLSGNKGTDYFDWHIRSKELFGDDWGFHTLFNTRSIIITYNPDTVEHFLSKEFKKYKRASDAKRFYDLFGSVGAIFTSNGDVWKSLRNTAKPFFRGKALYPMMDVFLERAKTLCAKLDDCAASNETIDMQELFYRYTLDSIGEIGFGVNIDSLSKRVAFSSAFDKSQKIVDNNHRSPWLKWLPDKEFEQCLKVMDDFVLDIIRARRKESEEALKAKTDLLSRYMLLTDADGKPLSDVYLRDLLINLFIAGRDTTATLLSWTFYMFSQHPEVEQRVVDEMDEKLGEGKLPGNSEQLKDLVYLMAVLKETLRLYPPVPSDARTVAKEDVLPTGIRRCFTTVGKETEQQMGCYLHIVPKYSSWVLHRHPDYWEDPLTFNPDRWLQESGPLKHKHQYVPFHAGAQLCLGQKMAYIEAQTAVCSILRKFRLRLKEGHRVLPDKAIVLKMEGGLPMKVQSRTTDVDPST